MGVQVVVLWQGRALAVQPLRTQSTSWACTMVSMLAGVGGRKADTLEDIRMRLEKEQIESLQRNKKIENPVGTTAIMLNNEIDHQTECLVRIAELESALKLGSRYRPVGIPVHAGGLHCAVAEGVGESGDLEGSSGEGAHWQAGLG